jgi:hypothetical protein
LSGKLTKESSTRIQDFALCKVSCQLTAGNPTSPAKESIQASSPQDLALAFFMSMTHKFLPKDLKDSECEIGTLTIQTPIPYVPPINLHEKRDAKQIKVKLPDGTNFQMSTFGQGNNRKYLAHIIAVKHLLE